MLSLVIKNMKSNNNTTATANRTKFIQTRKLAIGIWVYARWLSTRKTKMVLFVVINVPVSKKFVGSNK